MIVRPTIRQACKNMNKETLTDLEREKLEREEVMLNDYFAHREMPAIDVDAELETFKNKHITAHTTSLRTIAIAIISVAAVALMVFTLFKHTMPERETSPRHSVSGLVAYEARPSQLQDITIAGDDGTRHVLHQEKLAFKPNKAEAPIVLRTLTTPSGRTAEIQLTDGTTVWLNANSKLTFPDRFTGKNREVTIDGEAYFKVSHDANHPFIVKTDKMTTRVLGTEFDVNTDYHNSQCVTLVKGCVQVCSLPGKTCTQMAPGENALLTRSSDLAVRTVDTNLFCAWKDGNFYFDNTTLWDIAQELGRWYNVSVIFNNPRLTASRIFLTASRHSSLEEVLQMVNSLNKARFTLKNGQIIID